VRALRRQAPDPPHAVLDRETRPNLHGVTDHADSTNVESFLRQWRAVIRSIQFTVRKDALPVGRGHSTYLESQQYLLSTCWILLQSLVHETRRCTVYPISTCPLLYRPLLRLPFVLVYCTCSLPVPLLSLVSATATPTTPFTLQVAATPHLKSTVATSHHPPQPPPLAHHQTLQPQTGGGYPRWGKEKRDGWWREGAR